MPGMATLSSGGAKNFGQTSRVGYAWGSAPNLTYRSGSNIVHIFNSSGAFIPTRALSNVEYLVIGGGGGGGGGFCGGGGGGAGGYRSSVVGELSGGGAAAEARVSFSAYQHVTVTVGAGGNGFCGYRAYYTFGAGGNGSASTFGTITAAGGGGGGGFNSQWVDGQAVGCTNTSTKGGLTGGSGGGGAGGVAGEYSCASCAYPGGAGTGSQGYAGGSGHGSSTMCTQNYQGFFSTHISGGGGGGAGGAGGNVTAQAWGGSTMTSGNGGAGRASSITGVSVTRAGGGAGGCKSASDKFGIGTTSGGGGRATGIETYNSVINSLSPASTGRYWPGPHTVTVGYYAMNPNGTWCQGYSEYIDGNSLTEYVNISEYVSTAGQKNTGGGGGGMPMHVGHDNNGGGIFGADPSGSGGSGVVIVRYAA